MLLCWGLRDCLSLLCYQMIETSFKSSLGLLFLASLLWSAFTHEPELNSLPQCLRLVPPGMLHNRAWHWLAQDVTMGFCQRNHIHIYV
jgi:hypothetical protein